MNKQFLYVLSLLCCPSLFGAPTVQTKKIDDANTKIALTFDIPKDDYLYSDYFSFSVDSPDITLSEWKTDASPTESYDATFGQTKKIIDKPCTVTLTAHTNNSTELTNANIHVTYYQKSQKKIVEELVPVTVGTAPQPITDKLEQNIDIGSTAIDIKTESSFAKASADRTQKGQSWSAYLSDLIKKSDSMWFRVLLVLFLGVLLSLTPCIYPMIPITVGILQSQGSTSVLRNFLLSSAYTSGVATTFALLGLLAAFTGQLFGSIMANPFVILTIVALMIYLALSMFGLYEMYIPKSLQQGTSKTAHGSVLSAFLFGAVSGSVASPCLSPGLVLLLGIVTTLASKLAGFVLLFAFGVGISLPLLIIGTFSGSINMLPKAGMWMVEVKKLFGFVMLAMCFYFLNGIMSWHLLISGFTIFVCIAGCFYIYAAQNKTGNWYYISSTIGITLLASSVFFSFQTVKSWHNKETPENAAWLTDYQEALEKARKEKKLLFITVSGPLCSLCQIVDKKLLHSPKILSSLSNTVSVKINGTDRSNPHNKDIPQKYNVLGFPTLLLVDAETESVVKEWSTELEDMTEDLFDQELQKLTRR